MNEKWMEVKAYFFGSEAQKEYTYFHFIIPYFKNIVGNYFADRGWNGGPHYRVVIPEKFAYMLAPLQQQFQDFVTSHFGQLSKEEIKANLQKYEKQNSTISQMESVQYEHIDVQQHVKVNIAPYSETYLHQTFNSYHHFLVHHHCLFQMQTFISSNGERFIQIDDDTKLRYLIRMMYDVLTFSAFSPKYAVLVYVSNIEGVMALAEKYGKKELFEKSYQSLYEKVDVDAVFEDSQYEREIGAAWNEVIGSNFAYIKEQASHLFTDEPGYYTSDKQKQTLIDNMEGIPSEFHHYLLSNELDQTIQHEEHIIYRVLMNIVYRGIYMLQFSFSEKNFACYAVCQYMMDKHNTSWKEILQERRGVL
ncbi:hypothetical protein [Longirhabdus pacifica]|uniref:hypothetical protein n=1 Tax=Longirhabdus pacifica TaxID=2305227 RepID=UPI001008FA1F|nr:hypothetical protein [Longirhabdus pacifica]